MKPREVMWWISAIASCARRFGRNPYEHGWKSASKIGSSTAFKLAWTTRSATVGDTELAELPAFLRYQHLPHHDRPELTRLQRIPDLPQELGTPSPSLDSGHRDPIGTRRPCPSVTGNALPGMHQKCRVIYEVEQISEPAGRILSRPAVQLGLHLPYCEIRRIWMRPSHGAGIPRRIFGHYSSSLTDTLPPFPMRRALPGSEYYDGSAPPAPFGRRRGYPPVPARTAASAWNGTRAVPTFTAARSTGDLPLRHHHGYAADLHRGLAGPGG